MREATAVALMLGAVLSGLAACTSGNPGIELSQATAGPGATPTVTVTVLETVGPTVTTTATATVATTVTAGPTVTVTMLPRPTLTTAPAFTQAVALVDYANVIADIRLLDSMTLTGSPAALQLDVLARHYAALGANGSPPGLDPPTYYARLKSLELFANAASDEAAASSPQAAARYVVIRQETGVLFSLVNGALKTSLALPPGPTTRATP